MFLAEVANHADFYKDGFFGYGNEGDFKYFSLAYFIPIVLLIGAIILTYIYREKISSYKHEKHIRYILACSILFFEMGYFWRLLYCGTGSAEVTTLLTKLPFQVCEWTAIFASIMLFTENKSFFDIDVFVCLTLGAVPLITPAVISTTGPKYFRYYQFYGEHALPIYSVFYMMFVKGFKFNIKAIYKPIIFLVILAIISIILNNNIENANYLYLATNTTGSSIANILPKNIYIRLAIYTGVVLALFAIEFGIFKFLSYLGNKNKAKLDAALESNGEQNA